MKKALYLLELRKSFFLKIAFVLCVLININSTKLNAQQTWVLEAQSSDEFSGSELDTLKWNKGLWYSTSGQLAFKNSNITVADGNLLLTAKTESYNGKAYTIGAVESKFDIPGHNSYVEVRAKVLTSSANVLSAIWMQSSPLSSSLDPNPEIDIMESFNFNQYSQALHLWHTTNGHTALGGYNWNTGVDISLDYHLYKLERINGKLKFYFDGVLTWETSPADQSFYDLGRHMVLSLEGHLGTPNAAQLPKSFLVDYVRTYVATGPNNYVGNHSFELGDLTSWGGWGSISSIDNTNPQDGIYAVKLTGNPGAANQIITGLLPNTTYKLTGWTKVPSNVSNNEVYMGVKAYKTDEEVTERVLIPNTNLYTKNSL